MTVYLLGIHLVESYETWEEVFNSRVEARRLAGCLGGTIYHESDGKTQRAIALLKWDNRKNLEDFLETVKTKPF